MKYLGGYTAGSLQGDRDMKRWMAGVLCALLACTVWASGGPGEVRKQAEASMLVTGWIEVMPDGSVHNYTIDHPEKIPVAISDLIQRNVPKWQFKLEDHEDVIRRARMNIRIIAKRVDDQHDSIAISGASFGEGDAKPTDSITYKDRTSPHYPSDAVNARVGGTVFLYARIGRDGRVQNIAVEQVNLGVYGSEAQMRHYRKVLGDAALNSIKNWTFNIPTTGKQMMDPYWDGVIPVTFEVNDVSAPKKDTYGRWEAYVPGPRESIPWMKSSHLASSPDTIPEGGFSQVDQPVQLKTALDGA
ncbi:energy transducer TonB [Dyella sp.]|uniref:energy transducer TonB n=1 Tax=Dyella sp. TaxID=1869338 RepID=UPI002FD93B92